MSKFSLIIKNIKEKFNNSTEEKIICTLLLVSVFLHYAVTVAVIVLTGILILLKNSMRSKLQWHKSYFFLFIFSAVTLISGLLQGNSYGALFSILFTFIFIVGIYLRSVMTVKLFEDLSTLLCFIGIPLSVAVAVDRLINLNTQSYRCTLWFCNSNYLSSILAVIVFVCAYKEITKAGKALILYLIAFCTAVAIYFCGSLFIWVEIFIGIAVFLSFEKKHTLLGMFLVFCAFAGVIIYCVPELIPRLNESNITTDNRVVIWQDAIHHIPEYYIFGGGFFTFRTLTDVAYHTSHAHNIIIEPLLSFGIVGSALLFLFFVFYYRTVVICKGLIRKSRIPSLILAISAGVLIHCMIDMTVIWPQTALLYTFIMSGVGATEKIVVTNRLKRLSLEE